MTEKKSRKADLQNKRNIFYEIGFIVSLAITISVFATGKTATGNFSYTVAADYDITETVPVTVQEKTEKPRVVTRHFNQDIMEIVKKNDAVIDMDLSSVFLDDGPVIYLPKVEKEDIDDGVPVLITQFMPEFMDGDIDTFRQWVSQRLVYPAMAAQNNVQGKVTISFVIEKDGTLSNIEILNSPDKSLSEEAVRVIAQSPRWKPGRNNVTPVRV